MGDSRPSVAVIVGSAFCDDARNASLFGFALERVVVSTEFGDVDDLFRFPRALARSRTRLRVRRPRDTARVQETPDATKGGIPGRSDAAASATEGRDGRVAEAEEELEEEEEVEEEEGEVVDEDGGRGEAGGRHDVDAFVLFRHGLPHKYLPNQIPYRAHAAALRQLRCRALLVTSSVGVLRSSIPLHELLEVEDVLMPYNFLPDGTACTMFVRAGTPGQGHLVMDEGLFSTSLMRETRALAARHGLHLLHRAQTEGSGFSATGEGRRADHLVEEGATGEGTPSPRDSSKRGSASGGGDVSGGDVSGGDVSGGDVSGGDVSGGDVSGGDVSGGDVSGGDVSGGGDGGGDVSGGDVSGGGGGGGGGGVVFAYVQGPRTKTPAENAYWTALGADVNSMTFAPEVVLANELEIPTVGVVVGHKRSAGRETRAPRRVRDAEESPGALDAAPDAEHTRENSAGKVRSEAVARGGGPQTRERGTDLSVGVGRVDSEGGGEEGTRSPTSSPTAIADSLTRAKLAMEQLVALFLAWSSPNHRFGNHIYRFGS